MPTFMLAHKHEPAHCPTAFAAWRGFESPLRHHPVLASCVRGGHAIWWTVEAPDPESALAQLPPFVAERTVVTEVKEVPIP